MPGKFTGSMSVHSHIAFTHDTVKMRPYSALGTTHKTRVCRMRIQHTSMQHVFPSVFLYLWTFAHLLIHLGSQLAETYTRTPIEQSQEAPHNETNLEAVRNRDEQKKENTYYSESSGRSAYQPHPQFVDSEASDVLGSGQSLTSRRHYLGQQDVYNKCPSNLRTPCSLMNQNTTLTNPPSWCRRQHWWRG